MARFATVWWHFYAPCSFTAPYSKTMFIFDSDFYICDHLTTLWFKLMYASTVWRHLLLNYAPYAPPQRRLSHTINYNYDYNILYGINSEIHIKKGTGSREQRYLYQKREIIIMIFYYQLWDSHWKNGKGSREQGAEIFISQNINYNYNYMISTLRLTLEKWKREQGAGSRDINITKHKL